MKVLLTGGAGFIGSHTAQKLLDKGYKVRVIDSLEPPVHPRREKPAYISDDMEFILADIRNKSAIEGALQGIDGVIHLAAYQDYLTDFSRFAYVNDGGTALLYEVIVNNKLPINKVVVISSQAVYGEGKYFCKYHGIQYPAQRTLALLRKGDWNVKCPVCGEDMQNQSIDEAHVNPHNQYAISKYSQELYALNLGKRFNIPTTVLRYSITQGPRQSFHNVYSGILRSFMVRLHNNLPPIIYEDGGQLRDYVHVSDVVDANIMALESERMSYETYNVGGGEILSVIEYAKLITDYMNCNLHYEIPGIFRFGDTRHSVSDVSKLKSLGWKPKVKIDKIILDYVSWAENQPEIADYFSLAQKVMKDQGIIRAID